MKLKQEESTEEGDDDFEEEEPTDEELEEIERNNDSRRPAKKVLPTFKPARKEIEEIEEEPQRLTKTEETWKHFSQQEVVGFKNHRTGEVISSQEALRRLLNNTEEILRNTK